MRVFQFVTLKAVNAHPNHTKIMVKRMRSNLTITFDRIAVSAERLIATRITTFAKQIVKTTTDLPSLLRAAAIDMVKFQGSNVSESALHASQSTVAIMGQDFGLKLVSSSFRPFSVSNAMLMLPLQSSSIITRLAQRNPSHGITFIPILATLKQNAAVFTGIWHTCLYSDLVAYKHMGVN